MRLFDTLTLRTKLIVFFMLAIVIIGLASGYMYLSLKTLSDDATELFASNLTLTDAYRGIDALQYSLDRYLSTNASDDLLQFYDNLSLLNGYASALLRKAKVSRQVVGLSNTANMIANYVVEAEDTIVYKRRLNTEKFAERYSQTQQHHQAMKRYIESIMSQSLIQSTDRNNEIVSRMRVSTAFNIALMLVVVALTIYLIVGYSGEVTRPISQLADYSNRIAHGEYDLTLAEAPAKDEIGELYNNFQFMADSVRQSITSLEDKVRLEKVLASERLHLLEVQSALKEAELSALQAQVNPHFMFNTLNIGARLAKLQGDSLTSDYLHNTASIFRYNLKGLDQPATLAEELGNVRAYLALLKTRFQDMIDIAIDDGDDPAVLTYSIPRMTIQPLVENAYIHGVGRVETGGFIHVVVESHDEAYHVVVKNSGQPFDPVIADAVNSQTLEGINRSGAGQHGHTTGIGLNNLIARLQLFTKQRDVMRIDSEAGVTSVRLLLPKQLESDQTNV